MALADISFGTLAVRISRAASLPVRHLVASSLFKTQRYDAGSSYQAREARRIAGQQEYMRTLSYLALRIASATWRCTCWLSNFTFFLLKPRVLISEAVGNRFGRFRCNASKRANAGGSDLSSNLVLQQVNNQKRRVERNAATTHKKKTLRVRASLGRQHL